MYKKAREVGGGGAGSLSNAHYQSHHKTADHRMIFFLKTMKSIWHYVLQYILRRCYIPVFDALTVCLVNQYRTHCGFSCVFDLSASGFPEDD